MKKTQKIFAVLITLVVCFLNINFVKADTNNAGKINLSKTAIKSDSTYGRTATVTLGVTANSFTTSGKIDVVLVLDRSNSMDGNLMSNAKTASIDLINSLLSNQNLNNVRVGLATYGSSLLTSYSTSELTNNKSTLISLIESIPNYIETNEGTNIHAGLKHAYNLLSSSSNEKLIILLSDGDPTLYEGTQNNKPKVCGDGYGYDWEDNSSGCRVTINDVTYNKPSTVTKAYANYVKSQNIKIHTIGYNIGSSTSSTAKYLQGISSDPDSEYSHTAGNYNDLKTIFDNIVKNLTLVATGATVTDIVPEGFQIVENTLPSNAKATVNPDGTTTITWVIGDIESTDTNTLSYQVEAKKGYYGSMYTNAQATLTATTAAGNPAYANASISIDFEKPVVPIPPVTKDDNYTLDDSYDVKQGENLIVNKNVGILANDELITKVTDANATIVDKIILVNDGTTNGNPDDIVINSDGSFTYTSSSNKFVGNVTYKYFVETTVTINGVSTVVKSNTSTITLNVVKNPTTYVVNYLEKDTNVILHNPKNESGYVFDEVTESAINILGYNKVMQIEKTIILDKNSSNNVINVYYTKRTDLSYTVNYLEKDTNKVLSNSKTVDNQTYGEKINSSDEIIDIKGYNYDSVTPETLTIDVEGNVINVYYTKKNDLSYTVNYLEKDTNKVLSNSKTVENQTYGDEINSNDEVIEIKGYNYDSVTPETLTIDVEGNVINVYYTQSIGKVIAKYIDVDGNVLADSVITEGMVTTEYKTTAKVIDEYELLKIEGNEIGEYTEEDIVVTYVYEFVGGIGDGEEPEEPLNPEVPEIPQTGIEFDFTQYALLINLVFVAIVTLIVRKKYTI